MAQDEFPEGVLLAPIPADMEARWAQAAKLVEAGCECAMCGGTGGWPGIDRFVTCRPCNGTGSSLPISNSHN